MRTGGIALCSFLLCNALHYIACSDWKHSTNLSPEELLQAPSTSCLSWPKLLHRDLWYLSLQAMVSHASNTHPDDTTPDVGSSYDYTKMAFCFVTAVCLPACCLPACPLGARSSWYMKHISMSSAGVSRKLQMETLCVVQAKEWTSSWRW